MSGATCLPLFNETAAGVYVCPEADPTIVCQEETGSALANNHACPNGNFLASTQNTSLDDEYMNQHEPGTTVYKIYKKLIRTVHASIQHKHQNMEHNRILTAFRTFLAAPFPYPPPSPVDQPSLVSGGQQQGDIPDKIEEGKRGEGGRGTFARLIYNEAPSRCRQEGTYAQGAYEDSDQKPHHATIRHAPFHLPSIIGIRNTKKQQRSLTTTTIDL